MFSSLDRFPALAALALFSVTLAWSQSSNAGTPVSAIRPAVVGKTAAYWGNIFPNLRALSGQAGLTPLQAAYAVMKPFAGNETTGLYVLDFPGNACPNGCSKSGPNAFYNPQYSSLYAWRSIGASSYNGLQAQLQKRFSHVPNSTSITLGRSRSISPPEPSAPVLMAQAEP